VEHECKIKNCLGMATHIQHVIDGGKYKEEFILIKQNILGIP